MFGTLRSSLETFVQYEIAGFHAWRATAALAVLLAAVLFHTSLYTRLFSPLERLIRQTDTEADDYLVETSKAPVAWLVYLVALYLAALALELPQSTLQTVGILSRSAGTVIGAWLAFRILDVGVHFLDHYTEETRATIDDQLVPVVRRIGRLLLVIVSALLVVQQWGYDVGTLVAGLGIGGLGFALAARNMLTNWFGALMIFTDRPFEIGDWIETDYGTGTVEEVGLRSTRIRTYGRARIIVPNGEVARTAITNKSAVDRRHVEEKFGLVYQTTYEQLNEVLTGIRTLLDEHEAVADDDWRVYFVGFGESALQIEVSYFTADPGWSNVRATREELFLEILALVEETGTEFAHPTHAVRLEAPETGAETPESSPIA